MTNEQIKEVILEMRATAEAMVKTCNALESQLNVVAKVDTNKNISEPTEQVEITKATLSEDTTPTVKETADEIEIETESTPVYDFEPVYAESVPKRTLVKTTVPEPSSEAEPNNDVVKNIETTIKPVMEKPTVDVDLLYSNIMSQVDDEGSKLTLEGSQEEPIRI